MEGGIHHHPPRRGGHPGNKQITLGLHAGFWWSSELRAEVGAEPHRSRGSSSESEEFLEILKILSRPDEVRRGLIGVCRYSGPVCNG